MGGGGKGGTTTQSVSIPPEVLARYNAVNARAENVAQQPFMAYPGQFVAGLTPTQQQGISQTSQAAGMAQPYFGAAAGMTLAGSGGVGPLSQRQIAYYQDPFTQSVVNPTLAALQQQQGQERAQQQAQAIRAGAFGGDRYGLERANLARQQALGTAQAIAPLYSQGYQTGVQTAMGQQGVVGQDLQRMLAAGQQIGGLGAGAQQAALQGAQAQIGAGTLEQQTQQADLTARYQQFLQERGYPFQVAQFLANIAMGTGALSGSTTTTTQPTSFFSDERMKENIHPIGETFDGQTIYKYNYKGEPGTQIGLLAQEVERKHPEAVGEVGGMKTVNYDRATKEAGGLGKALSSMGGAVQEPGAFERGGYAPGGLVNPNDLQAILAAQRESFGPFGKGGPYGQSGEGGPYGGIGGIVPKATLPVSRDLMRPSAPPPQRKSGMQEVIEGVEVGKKIGTGFKEGSEFLFGKDPSKDASGKIIEGSGSPSLGERLKELGGMFRSGEAHGGGIRPHYAQGGGKGINPYDPKQESTDYFPEEVLEAGEDSKRELPKPGQAPGGGGGGLGQALGTAASAIGAASTIGKGIGWLASVLPFSDERLKHDIEPIGKTYDGQNIYRYHMGDGVTRMGLMAQEVAEHNPDAVARGPGGYLMLDYDKATGEAVPQRGGVRPRDGFQTGGSPEEEFDIVDRYWPKLERQESGGKQFDPKTGLPLTSSAGAVGVAQVMPKTAPEAARLAGVPFDETRYREDPEYNRALGQAYLREQFRTFKDPVTALAAYNAGPGRVRQAMARAEREGGSYLSYLPEETRNYVAVVGGVGLPEAARRAADLPSRGATAVESGGVSPAGLRGVVAQAQERGAAPEAGERRGLTPPTSFETRKPFESWGDFFTSRQFLVPFATGLGTMAASPSRYLGSAILQGIGGGFGAYGAMEPSMAQTQESVARKGLTEAQTETQRAVTTEADARAAGASIVDIQNVPHILVRDKRTGQQRYVNFNIDYKRNPSQYELIITRQPGGLGAAAPIVSGATDTMPAPGIKPIGVERRELPPPPGGEAAPAGTAAPAAPAAPAGGVMPPTATGPFSLTPNAIDAARREAENRFNLPTATIQDRPDLLVAQTKAAEGAETIKPTLIQIGILGSTPRTGMTAQGPLQPVLSEIAGLANDVSRRLFGPTVNPFSAADIADYESWKKKLTELSAAAAKAGDQTAVESLKRLKDLYPAPDQTPGGFAANLAELMVTNQKDIQRAKFFADYSRIAQGDDPRLPGRFDPAAARIFEQEYGGVFEQQREALKRMLRADDPRFLPRDERGRNFLDKNGRPMSWFTYLQMNGSKLSPEQVAEIERAFKAPGIMEYFRTGMGAQ